MMSDGSPWYKGISLGVDVAVLIPDIVAINGLISGRRESSATTLLEAGQVSAMMLLALRFIGGFQSSCMGDT